MNSNQKAIQQAPTAEKCLRFGVFTFKPEALELFRGNNPIPLKSQAAKVLALLLQAPGELVSRYFIAQSIWGDREVDIDGAINACIRDIRKALDDSVDTPRMVETLPKRGYRLIVNVQSVNLSGERQYSRWLSRGRIRIVNKRWGIGDPGLISGYSPVLYKAVVFVSLVTILLVFNQVGLLRESTDQPFAVDVELPVLNPYAIRSYLEGRAALLDRTEPGFRIAGNRFREALEDSPHLSNASAALAEVLFLSAAPSDHTHVLDAISAALVDDPQNARLYILRGKVFWAFKHDWQTARENFEIALRMNPKSVEALMMLARSSILERDFSTASKWVDRARLTNPEETTRRGDAGWIRYLAGDFVASRNFCDETALLVPKTTRSARCYIDLYLAENDFVRAREAAISYMHAAGATNSDLQLMQENLAEQGMIIFFHWDLNRHTGSASRGSPRPVLRALSHTRLKQPEAAVRELEVAVQSRNYYAPFIAIIPEFRPLYERDDFQGLLNQLSLSNLAL